MIELSAKPACDRLGDLLVRQRYLSPHQVGVALEVQRKTRLPLGRILVETEIISPLHLTLTLTRQKLSRLLGQRRQPRPTGLYGVELVSWARARLERHLTVNADKPATSPKVAQTVQMRSELAGLSPTVAGRIVDRDDVLKEKLLTGNL